MNKLNLKFDNFKVIEYKYVIHIEFEISFNYNYSKFYLIEGIVNEIIGGCYFDEDLYRVTITISVHDLDKQNLLNKIKREMEIINNIFFEKNDVEKLPEDFIEIIKSIKIGD